MKSPFGSVKVVRPVVRSMIVDAILLPSSHSMNAILLISIETRDPTRADPDRETLAVVRRLLGLSLRGALARAISGCLSVPRHQTMRKDGIHQENAHAIYDDTIRLVAFIILP